MSGIPGTEVGLNGLHPLYGHVWNHGITKEIDSDKIVKLSKFLLDKLNVSIEDMRLGVDRLLEIYNIIELTVDFEPICTRLDRMDKKIKTTVKGFDLVHKRLTKNNKDHQSIFKKKKKCIKKMKLIELY